MAFTVDQIEDGTGKPGAVVYGRTADPVLEASTHLVLTGKTKFASLTGNLTVGAIVTPNQDMHLRRGVRYVEDYAFGRVEGRPSIDGQALLQPRIGQTLDGRSVPSDGLVQRWLEACWEAAELSAAGESLYDVVDPGREVKRERTGQALETEWFQGGGSSNVRKYPAIVSLLKPLLAPVGVLERG